MSMVPPNFDLIWSTSVHPLTPAQVSFTYPTDRLMHIHSKTNCLQTIPLLFPLEAGQKVSGPLIVTETHNGGITLHTLKTIPVFDEGMWFRELIAYLHSTIVISARCLTCQNVKLPVALE